MYVINIDIPPVANLRAEGNCSDVTANWNRLESPYKSSLFNVSLKSFGGNVLRTVITSNASYTFSNVLSSTTGFIVSVVALSGNNTVEVTAQVLLLGRF